MFTNPLKIALTIQKDIDDNSVSEVEMISFNDMKTYEHIYRCLIYTDVNIVKNREKLFIGDTFYCKKNNSFYLFSFNSLNINKAINSLGFYIFKEEYFNKGYKGSKEHYYQKTYEIDNDVYNELKYIGNIFVDNYFFNKIRNIISHTNYDIDYESGILSKMINTNDSLLIFEPNKEEDRHLYNDIYTKTFHLFHLRTYTNKESNQFDYLKQILENSSCFIMLNEEKITNKAKEERDLNGNLCSWNQTIFIHKDTSLDFMLYFDKNHLETKILNRCNQNIKRINEYIAIEPYAEFYDKHFLKYI